MIADLVRAAFGIGRLARFDRSGLAFFGNSGPAAWRSFLAVALVAPMFVMWTAMHWQESPDNELTLTFLVREGFAYTGLWLLYPVVAWHLISNFGREERFAHFVCAYNWGAAYQNALFLILDVMTIGLGASDGARSFFGLILMCYLLAFGWFLAKNALQVSGPQAAAVVALDFFLSAVWETLT